MSHGMALYYIVLVFYIKKATNKISMKISKSETIPLCVITPCRVINLFRRFGRTCCQHFRENELDSYER